MNEERLANILTVVILITVVGAVFIYMAPGINDGIKEIIIKHTPGNDEPEIIDIEFRPPKTSYTPRERNEIENLMNDIMLENPARKAQYARSPNKIEDVHVSLNMAIDQAEWIRENYDYNVGIVMLWRGYLGTNLAQTWVDVNGTRYVIDSTSNYYWTVDEHESQWHHDYKIQYTTIKKGLEHEKENNEYLNQKDF